ncbi:hypothetical protein P3T76_013136 [Phytophthora citrophthora]|uniref:Uncharacterized protein n=1 Tax=Phytophthora citrophthora TaxID=4793 RepID=A0AAD9G489_9STRA|nr:hypothetical protein P3T76_013136 [Phytophthora citrophthora]
MSTEVAQHFQQMIKVATAAVSKRNSFIGEMCGLFKALEQLQPILEVFLDENSSAKAMTIGKIEYARKQHDVEKARDEEATNAQTETQGGKDRLLTVTPIQLDHQVMEEGNSSPSAFSPDQLYRFEADTSNVPAGSPANMEADDAETDSAAADSDEFPAELNDPTDGLTDCSGTTNQFEERSKQNSQSSSETPSEKLKPTPERYRFDIVRYWKDAPPEVQTRIEERFERMEPLTKNYKGVDIDPVKRNDFFWIPEKNPA